MLIYLSDFCFCCICNVATTREISYPCMLLGVCVTTKLYLVTVLRAETFCLKDVSCNASQKLVRCTQLHFTRFIVFGILGSITRYYIVYYEHNLIERIRLLQETDLIHWQKTLFLATQTEDVMDIIPRFYYWFYFRGGYLFFKPLFRICESWIVVK